MAMRVKVDIDMLEQVSAALDYVIPFLKEDCRLFQQHASFTNDEWSGTAANSYKTAIEKNIKMMKQSCDNIEMLNKLIKSHAKNYRQLDKLV